MADDEAPGAEVVDELLGRVDRPAHADLVADRGERPPAGQHLAGVDDGDAGGLEHRRRLRRRRSGRPAERPEHVGDRDPVLRTERVPAVEDHPGPGGGGDDAGRQPEMRRVGDAVVGAGAGDERPAAGGLAAAAGVAHRLGEAGELGRRLALDPDRDQEGPDLGGRDRAGQEHVHRRARLDEGQVAAAADAGADGLDRRPEAVVDRPALAGAPGAAARRRLGRRRRCAGALRRQSDTRRFAPSGSVRRSPGRAWPAGGGCGRRPSARRRSSRSPRPGSGAPPGCARGRGG